MEEIVNVFLEKDTIKRVLRPNSKNWLFECLSEHVFNVKLNEFQNVFKLFMQSDENKVLFKSVLQLLDNTGKVPMKQDNEKDKAFKKRLDECYDRIAETYTIKPNSNFLQVYLCAIATLIHRPIFILNQDEAGDLSWSYFPFLYDHNFDLGSDSTKYKANGYITMCFYDNHCYMIDSSMCLNQEPVSYGRIGVYARRFKAILMGKDITERCVTMMAQGLQRPEVQYELKRQLNWNIISRSVRLYTDRSQSDAPTLPASILSPKPSEGDFVEQLLIDKNMLKCLFEVTVDANEGCNILGVFDSKDGCHPLQYHGMLLELEKSVFTLQDETTKFVTSCRAAKQELSKRKKKANYVVIGGSAVGIIGGGIACAGIILTPFTFGASLGLTIGGSTIGAAGSALGGVARAFEGVKEDTTIDTIKKETQKILDLEEKIVKSIHEIIEIIDTHDNRNFNCDVEGSRMNTNSLIAIGCTLRLLHAPAAIAVSAFRVCKVGATVAASTLGTLSIALDVGFMTQAFCSNAGGCKTGTGLIVEQNVRVFNMRKTFIKCMLRGNIPINNWRLH